MINTRAEKPTVYEEMSVTLFVSGFLMVMAGEKDDIKPYMLQCLQVLMEDAESYGWGPSWGLNQLRPNPLNHQRRHEKPP